MMSAPLPCYLVEWYRSGTDQESLCGSVSRLGRCAASMSAHGSQVRLLNMLAVPSDEVVFGVFRADSAEVVSETCDLAGVPAQRVTAAADVDVPAITEPEAP